MNEEPLSDWNNLFFLGIWRMVVNGVAVAECGFRITGSVCTSCLGYTVRKV